MAAHPNPILNPEPSRPPNRRDLLRSAAAATLGLAASGLDPSASAGEILDSVRQSAARIHSGPTLIKQRALADYQANMREFGGSLASPLEQLISAQPTQGPYQYDVLVIGSGYGAAVCAARLAQKMRSGARLAVLERGREWMPGSFPDSRSTAAAESRFEMLSLKKNKIRNPLGLYSAARFDEVNVLSGNGLGGGSLINASVAYWPEPEKFDDPRWPGALRDGRELTPYYQRAMFELDPGLETACSTPKMNVMQNAASRLAAIGGRVAPANVTVTRGPADNTLPLFNRQGLRQRACIDCGDCTTGCNVGAKHMLSMNYLPLARRHGAKIFTQCEAMSIEPCDGYYRLHFKYYLGCERDREAHTCHTVTSRVIVLGAGSLGSTELLLRSRERHQLSLSPALGKQWSANGDAIGFVFKMNQCTNIGGQGTYPTSEPPVGPTIQTNLTFPQRADIRQRILIQEGSVARAYANLLGCFLRDLDYDRTMLLFAMGRDDGSGQISLDANGRGVVRWPGLKDSAYRRMVQQEFQRVGEALGGKYHVLRPFGENLVTVHPLGGCNMGDDPDCGVVNDLGQVYDPNGASDHRSAAVQPGLYAADGAIVPAALGVNPFLTITALAERIAQRITEDPAYADLFG